MTVLDNILKNALDLDIDKMLKEVWTIQEIQDYIVELNTEGESTSQLWVDGVDSNNEPLREYAGVTKRIKALKNQPFDRTTLKDTGAFYKTFVVQPLKDGFNIDANPIKDDDNLFDKYGIDILGLTPENRELLGKRITTIIIEKTIEKILRND